jgi:hypothetical protein
MPGSSSPGPLGINANTPIIDEGTSALTTSPPVGTVGSDAAVAVVTGAAAGAAAAAGTETDPNIEALNLRGNARNGAYALKKAHPSVKFTSGRRDKEAQASAMAGNVVKKRKWIQNTYVSTTVSQACQKWVDDNPEKTTKEDIAAGLLSVLNEFADAQLAVLSKHLSGDAFDVQPVETDADAIKKTIRELDKLHRFLEKEDGLVRWHAQFL